MIGGSCVELASGSSRLLIDFGSPLRDKSGEDMSMDKYSSLSSKELIRQGILPDIPGLYDCGSLCNVSGILISHAHFDHYRLSNYIRKDIPFYLGAAASELINITGRFTKNKINITFPQYFKAQTPFGIGDFTITPFLNDHSAFDAYSFLIEAEGIRVYYTGDFRKHGRKTKAFYRQLETVPKGVDYLIMEGTNIGQSSKSFITEREIENKLVEIFDSSENINLIYTSGQNIDRLVSLYRACLRTGKLLVVDFYIAEILQQLSQYARVPYPSALYGKLKVAFPYFLSKRFSRDGKLETLYKFKNFKITKEEISANLQNIVMVIRPSFKKDLDHIRNIDGGNLIYSMWTGYMEKKEVADFIEYLEKERCFTTIKLHTRGHADLATLQEFVSKLGPKNIIPIHTEAAEKYKEYFSAPILLLKDGVEQDLL